MINYFVSSTGSDSNDGLSPAASFRTFERAAKAVRTFKCKHDMFAGVTVNIMAGIYHISEPFVLTAEDSGCEDTPICYKSYNGPVRINGGVFLKDPRPVTDSEILSRLSPEVRDKIIRYDLTANGVSNIGNFSERGFAKPVRTAHLELFCNDSPLIPARYPNTNEYLHIKAPKTEKHADGFYYDSDRPDGWKEDSNIWMHGYWSYDWSNTYEHAGIIHKAQKYIRATPPNAEDAAVMDAVWGNYNYIAGQRFYFLNVLEELTQPGEYYIDREKYCVYVYPPDDIRTAEVVASVCEQPLFKLEGAANLVFSGLTFECGRSDGLAADNYRNITLESCCFKNFGNRGAVIKTGKGLTVKGCDFYGMGDGCLDITGGDRKTLESGEIEICNNHFHHFARWTRCYNTAINSTGVGIRIHHNLFHDCPHTAILYYGNEYDIEHNEFYSTCMETGDSGAIYMGFDLTYRGIRINDNIFHNIGSFNEIGSFAVYCDCCQGGTIISNNYFYDLSTAISNNGGYNVKVEGNVCLNAKMFVNFAGHGMHPGEGARDNVVNILKPGFDAVDAGSPVYTERYPEMLMFDKIFKDAEAEGKPAFLPPSIEIENNIIKNTGTFIKRHWLIKDDMMNVSNNMFDYMGDLTDPDFGDIRPIGQADGTSFDKIGLTDEPRFSVPVKICGNLKKVDACTLRLTLKNFTALPVKASVSLFDMLNIPLPIGDNIFDFYILPGETIQHDYRGEFAEGVQIEARSATPGVRPARVYT